MPVYLDRVQIRKKRNQQTATQRILRQAIAFERDMSRVAMIGENADRLGAPRLKVVPGEAPASLEGAPRPDACFIGGGMGTEGVFEACWAALRPRGRMVANVVTLLAIELLPEN